MSGYRTSRQKLGSTLQLSRNVFSGALTQAAQLPVLLATCTASTAGRLLCTAWKRKRSTGGSLTRPKRTAPPVLNSKLVALNPHLFGLNEQEMGFTPVRRS